MAIRALAFDVFGTLVDWRSGIAEAFRAAGVADVADEAGVAGAGAEALADGWRARYRPILEEVNAGDRPWGDFDELHLVTLDDLLAEHGLSVESSTRRELVAAWHRLEPWPDVVAGLEELHRGRATAALSNGHTALLVDLARFGGLRFDAVLSAELVRAYKPAPEVYLMGARMLGVVPAELMLVAAHPWDLAGAREAGVATGFVDRPLEYGPGSPARSDPSADESVAGLDELAARLA